MTDASIAIYHDDVAAPQLLAFIAAEPVAKATGYHDAAAPQRIAENVPILRSL